MKYIFPFKNVNNNRIERNSMLLFLVPVDPPYPKGEYDI